MATVNPSIARAYVASQDCFTITYPLIDTHQTFITTVSKADPAVVSVGPETVIISATGTVASVAGSGPWTAVITGMTTTAGLKTGDIITATAGAGDLGTGTAYITEINGNTKVTIATVDDSPAAGSITAISIVAPSILPVDVQEGRTVLINNVGGMTELATAGIDGTNQFTVGTVNVNSFELAGVDSSAFTTATANTGFFQTFSVPEFNHLGTGVVLVKFDESGPVVGSDISIDTDTGVISLAGGDFTYSMTATAEINLAGATYQWYNVTNSPVISAIGSSAPVGTPVTALYSPADPEDVALVVTTSNGARFTYPTQITNAQAVISVASGFVA